MPRPYTDLSNPPRLDAPIGTRFIPLRRDVIFVICDDLQNLRLGIPSVPGFSPSTITPGDGSFEVFTCRARHASPLHRFIEPTAPGRASRRHHDLLPQAGETSFKRPVAQS